MKFNYSYTLLVIFLWHTQLFCQQSKTDSLKAISYQELRSKFNDYQSDTPSRARIYAQMYITKAKNEKDSLNIANGYAFMSYLCDKENTIKYCDSILVITKNSKHRSYPTLGYLLKGHNYKSWGEFEKASYYFLEAYSMAVEKNNIDDQLFIQKHIASIKSYWGNYHEALLVYKDVLSKIEKEPNYRLNKRDDYLNGLYNLSLSYLDNKLMDSSLIYINKGIKESLALRDSTQYYSFVFTSGTRNVDLKKYDLALDSINKALPYLTRDASISIAHYYKGKIYKEKGIEEKYLTHFLKSDSIYQITQDEFPELIEVYQTLSKHYKNKGDNEKQLLYLNKLIELDSILDYNYQDVNKMIVEKYDRPNLFKEKNRLINQLKEKKNYFSKFILFLSVIVVLCAFFIFSLRKKNKTYKKKFEELINDDKKVNKDSLESFEVRKQNIKEPKKLNISEEVVNIIIKELEKFEKGERFMDVDITINKLAKSINTNANYLSKVINHYKQKNYTNYVNDLRIDYAVKKLKSDINFRKYSIEAIANEVGFNKAQSFSSAFYRKTGIKPSYFINNLNKM